MKHKPSTIPRRRQKVLNARKPGDAGHCQKKHKAGHWWDITVLEFVRRYGHRPDYKQTKAGLR